MTTQIIRRSEARRILQESGGRFFSTTFIKRTTDEPRHMVCLLGVKKYVKGVGMAFDPEDYNLMTVFDIQKRDYRMICLDEILEAKVNGQRYLFRD